MNLVLQQSYHLPILDYGDLLYSNAPAHSLHMLVYHMYHGALRLIPHLKPSLIIAI